MKGDGWPVAWGMGRIRGIRSRTSSAPVELPNPRFGHARLTTVTSHSVIVKSRVSDIYLRSNQGRSSRRDHVAAPHTHSCFTPCTASGCDVDSQWTVYASSEMEQTWISKGKITIGPYNSGNSDLRSPFHRPRHCHLLKLVQNRPNESCFQVRLLTLCYFTHFSRVHRLGGRHRGDSLRHGRPPSTS